MGDDFVFVGICLLWWFDLFVVVYVNSVVFIVAFDFRVVLVWLLL